jgi:CHAT domain-containing protein
MNKKTCLIVALFFITFPSLAQSLESNKILKDSLDFFVNDGDFNKATPFAEKLAENLKSQKGKESNDYQNSLEQWGRCLQNSGQTDLAEQRFIELLHLQKTADSSDPAKIIKTLRKLGRLQFDDNNSDKSEMYYLQALAISDSVYGKISKESGKIQQDLGFLFLTIKQKKGLEYLEKALDIFKNVYGEKHEEVALTYYRMGIAHKQDNKSKSEKMLLISMDIYTSLFGEFHIKTTTSYDGLCVFYSEIGNFKKALFYGEKALKIHEKVEGENSGGYGLSLLNLGIIYANYGDIKKAEEYYNKTLKIWLALNNGEENTDIAIVYYNLGGIYNQSGISKRAEFCMQKSYEIFKKAYKGGRGFSRSYESLGMVYRDMGEFEKAVPFYLKSIEWKEKHFEPDNFAHQTYCRSLGLLYYYQKKYAQAEPYLIRNTELILKQFDRVFPSFSDDDKAEFYNLYKESFDELISLAINYHTHKPELLDRMFDLRLATKALLLNSSAKWKQRIKGSHDRKLLSLFGQWEDNQAKLGKLYQSTDPKAKIAIDTLLPKTERLEKELSLRSEHFATLSDKKIVRWQDVQKKLKSGEAAVEMIRIPKFGIEKMLTDTSDPARPVHARYGFTDTILYAALIVKPGTSHPELVLLKSGNTMEGKDWKYYRNCIEKQIRDEHSYSVFWKPFEQKLGPGIKRIYFSGDGIFHSLNLNTLFNPATKKYLLEEKEISLITNSKDLLIHSNKEEQNHLAYLIGFPNYNTNAEKRKTLAGGELGFNSNYYFSMTRGEAYSELPGTKVEVEGIGKILSAKGWEVQSYLGDKALEENLKDCFKPRILHLATHGYFEPDSARYQNPLLRSGILLTGANNSFLGEKDDNVEDGILTAYEAMNLNLDNTDLVVLSACETGLGEIKNGEGVYGLQRAFKVAGAKSIIMSLWKVDDEATQELMVSFYKHWLGEAVGEGRQTANGNSKRSAFLKAQKELKAKYPNPYYWGAFVMVGE